MLTLRPLSVADWLAFDLLYHWMEVELLYGWIDEPRAKPVGKSPLDLDLPDPC